MTKQLDQNEIAYLKAKQEKAELEFKAICWGNKMLRINKSWINSAMLADKEEVIGDQTIEDINKYIDIISNKLNLPF